MKKRAFAVEGSFLSWKKLVYIVVENGRRGITVKHLVTSDGRDPSHHGGPDHGHGPSHHGDPDHGHGPCHHGGPDGGASHVGNILGPDGIFYGNEGHNGGE